MITVNGKELRNLEEQVQANKNNIERIIEGEELLARLGIKVVGQVEAESELPNPVTYAGDFGDAFLVGLETPYDYYIFTRPFEGETDPQWFNLGPFPVAGPQGPQGIQGPKGADGVRGSQWFSGTGQPTTTSGYNLGDYYINVGTGNIWHLHDVDGVAKWLLEGNIMGPTGAQGPQGLQGLQGEQGPQGIQGPSGPAGPVVDIIGELANVDQLPAPGDVARNAAYLVPISGVKHVFIIIGEDDDLSWYDAGIFSGGTIVKVSGTPVNEFNADTKLTTGASLDYSLSGGLKVYTMSGGSRTNNYAALNQNGIIEARAGTNNSAQVAAGAVTVTTPTHGSARLTPRQLLTKYSGSSKWNVLSIPVGRTGTIALTGDITSANTSLENKLMPIINSKNITSTSNYKAAGTREDIRLYPGKGKIMILRANDDSQKWTFRYADRNGATLEERAQLMIAFIPSESYSVQSGLPVYRPWIIKIDQGSLVPSVSAHTYDARVYDYFITSDMAEQIIGEFIPPNVGGTDVYEMYQG